ncbi:MAG: leucine-rich repeat protein [Clostridia bacterium]|nr:leucine-rich repeat protein [Clostridia bacterium]
MKKAISFLLIFALLVTALPLSAAASGEEFTQKELNNDLRYVIDATDTVSHHGYTYDVDYRLNVKTGEILSISFPNNNVVGNYITIPQTLAGYTVKGIGKELFKQRYWLCEVILPETVEYIGEDAFKECVNLYVVKMENPEKSQLKHIGSNAFNDLKLLFEAPIYDGLEYIGENAFSGTEAIEDITLPESLTHLGAYAFYNSKLKNVTIPEDLTHIGAYAFHKTPWLENYDADFVVEGNYVLIAYKGDETDVVLPNNIFHIADKVFAAAPITGITFNKRLKTIGDSVFEGCSYLTHVSIPDTVEAIGEGLFKNCKALTAASLPSHLTHIPAYTFQNTRLLEFDFSKIETIGSYAFGSTRLSGDFTLSSPMTYVGDHAFYGTSFTSVSVTDNVYLADYAFSQSTGMYGPSPTITEVNIDLSVKQMGGEVFYGTPWYNAQNTEFLIVGDGILIKHFSNARIEQLIVPDTVKAIASQAFLNTAGYGEIILPDTITHLGDYALASANADKIVLPDTITEMGKGVFQSSTVKTVVWPENITDIPDYTFYQSNISSFDFSHITSIGDYAFYNPKFLNVTIGDSVNKIGDYAFRGGRVTLHHLPESMGEYPFGNSDTATWSIIPEYYVDEDVFPYNKDEDYLILPDWVDFSVYVNITPEIIETGVDYVVVKFASYPPKSLGSYYGSGYQTIDSSHFKWLDEQTIKISDILDCNNQSIRFFEHYSGYITFQYNPIYLTGMGSSDVSFSLSNIKSIGADARSTAYTDYFLTRIRSQVDEVTPTFTPTTGQTFELYADESCTQYLGNTISLSYDPVTVWVKVTSQNNKNSAVYKWVFEYYYLANAPAFDIKETHFKNSLDVTISSTLEDGMIYYTTDSTEPSMTNGYLYDGAITITETTTFKAIVYAPHTKPSTVTAMTYTLARDMEITDAFPKGDSATISISPPTVICEKYLTAHLSSDGESWDSTHEVYIYPGSNTFSLYGLSPDTKYYVKITLPSASITSNVYSFTTSSFNSKTGFSYTSEGYITGMPEGDGCTVPEKIGTTKIVGIAPYAYDYVYGTITIPKTITDISPIGANASISFSVASANSVYKSDNGSLYNKDMTKLIRAGFMGKSNKEMVFTVPSTVKEIGDFAFYDTYFTSVTLNEGLETIGSNVFYGSALDIIRIPSSVTHMGENFAAGRNTAVIFLGATPQCSKNTFGENVVLYSRIENTTLYDKSVRLTANALSDFTSFFKPSVYSNSVDVSWCSEVDFDENTAVICKVLHTDGTIEVLTKLLSECYSNDCFFNTKSKIKSVKIFFWNKDNLSPYAYSEEINF